MSSSSTTTTTNMKPIMMMNASNSDAMDDPFADLPTAATDDPAFSATPQLVSPLEFGTGIKYLQEQQQHLHQQQQKETDATETTLEEEEDDTDALLEDTIDASPVVEPTTEGPTTEE